MDNIVDLIRRLRREKINSVGIKISPPPVQLEAAAEILRLRAELATARRDAWIAGRDAAAQLVDAMRREEYPDNDFRTIRARIAAMEPPA